MKKEEKTMRLESWAVNPDVHELYYMYIALLSKCYCHSFSIHLDIIVKTTSKRPKLYLLKSVPLV